MYVEEIVSVIIKFKIEYEDEETKETCLRTIKKNPKGIAGAQVCKDGKVRGYKVERIENDTTN